MSRTQYRRPRSGRNKLDFTCIVWLSILGVILGIVFVALAEPPRAHSDPGTPGFFDQRAVAYVAAHPTKVCAALTEQPTVDSLALIALDIMNNGHLAPPLAGQVINMSVRMMCPQHWNILEMFTGITTPMIPLAPMFPHDWAAPKGITV